MVCVLRAPLLFAIVSACGVDGMGFRNVVEVVDSTLLVDTEIDGTGVGAMGKPSSAKACIGIEASIFEMLSSERYRLAAPLTKIVEYYEIFRLWWHGWMVVLEGD